MTPANATVDTTGCPLDFDRDSVPDYLDKCPNSVRGVKVNKDVCPVNKKQDLDKLKTGINFKNGSTILTKPSYKTLDDIVYLMESFDDVKSVWNYVTMAAVSGKLLLAVLLVLWTVFR